MENNIVLFNGGRGLQVTKNSAGNAYSSKIPSTVITQTRRRALAEKSRSMVIREHLYFRQHRRDIGGNDLQRCGVVGLHSRRVEPSGADNKRNRI